VMPQRFMKPEGHLIVCDGEAIILLSERSRCLLLHYSIDHSAEERRLLREEIRSHDKA
jgi:hypothetical protein